MEASSLCASKSFSDLVRPANKAGSSTWRLPRRTDRVAHSQTIACSSVPSSGDDAADWRTFRARLVAAERSSVLTANPPPLPAGDRWAHPLHTPEKGCLLIASPRLDGVHIFERAIILLLSASPIPTGIILNRPSLMSIKETRSNSLDSARVFSDRPLLFGGPVECGLFLVANNREAGRAGVLEEVTEGVYYGGRESVGCAAEMVRRSVARADEFRFFHGCCRWERNQLREEVASGCWSVVACGGGVVERQVGRAEMWEDVMGVVGQRKPW